ncbi:uncharacterized protein C2orf42 homolog [Amia ocellicauda]|uniref:uncharacterized protein C2orf42 homolog n=1 Tax=Amia ocellicauda TaxID=2972642 RepID=UPI0034642112
MEGSVGGGGGLPAAPVSVGVAAAVSRDRTKTPPFLSNLGKPTLRGIRKCPQCGTYNGTRGLSCKNKACGAVFRGGARKIQPCAEAVRVVTAGGGSGGDEAGEEGAGAGQVQVFSVRQRGRGPELRGFVELGLTETAIPTADGTLITHISLGHCYVPACRQGSSAGRGTEALSSSAPLQPQESPCLHMKQAMECQAEATPLTLKSSLLAALQAPTDTKQTLWQLAMQTPGPLVQRVSRGAMVVKCQRSQLHPLGLLHLSFHERKEGPRFYCACQVAAKGVEEDGAGEVPMLKERGDPSALVLPEAAPAPHCPSPSSSEAAPSPEFCIHFYACICAFASDDKLASEFSGFMNYDVSGLNVSPGCAVMYPSEPQQLSESPPHKSKRLKLDDSLAVSTPKEGIHSPLRKPGQRKHPVSTVLKKPGSSQPVDEAHVSLPFQHWLASVTERIHQTMHFQFDGKPEPLVFHIPQAFFNALQQRLSLGSKKKRLPNSTTAFVRRDALPLGTFSKYTWHITSILQVKQIFDTPEMPLEVTQSFVKNRDGSFEPFRCPEVPLEPVAEAYSRADRQTAIRPLELRTFLRVGNTSAEQKEPTPFVIEWIPDILPKSRIGELRIRFEYGHLHNGHVEYADGQGGAPPLDICRVGVP